MTRIRELDGPEALARVTELAEVLRDCVEGGASVGFMRPLAEGRPEAFWRRVAEGVAAGERHLFIAEDEAGRGEDRQLQPPRADRDGTRALFEAAVSFEMRLPELFCGFPRAPGEPPIAIARRAMTTARLEGYDVVLLDTAGRLAIYDELMAEAARVPGVLRVNGLKLAQGDGSEVPEELPLRGLQLPRLLGLSVEVGDALPIDNLLGLGGGDGSGQSNANARGRVVPVPTVPREC